MDFGNYVKSQSWYYVMYITQFVHTKLYHTQTTLLCWPDHLKI